MADMNPKEIRSAAWKLTLLADAIDETYEQTGGEVTEIAEWFQRMLQDDAKVLVDAICAWEQELDGRDAICDAEIERLKRVKESTASRRAWGRKQLGAILDRLGEKRIETPTRVVSRTAGAKRAEQTPDAPPIDFADPKFVREVPAKLEWAKAVILKALKAGEPVEGWRLVQGELGVTVR